MANYTLNNEADEYIVYVPHSQSVEFYAYLHQNLEAFDVNVGVITGGTPDCGEDAFQFEKIPSNPKQQEELARLIMGFQPKATT